ncbi:long polar fimbrial protein LpfE [Enterobacteriaceae bacterium 89]|nr:long polar fimbrial protein LpfE [Enterobacteriaceae bacterium 89]
MKPTILLLLSLCASSVSAMTDLGSPGDIHFTISIRESACELTQKSIEVEMGSVLLPRPVTAGRELNQEPFTIGLENCSNVVRAYVSFDGTPDADDSSLFALEEGGATGVGIKITDETGVQLLPAAAGAAPQEIPVSSEDGKVEIKYLSAYKVTSSQAKSGKANALVNFSIVYE